MTVIAGSTLLNNPGAELSDQVADRDIVETNSVGQNVVLVPAGQLIPVSLLKAQHAALEDKSVRPKKRP